jgi:HlyD family secretion protein
MRPTAPFRAAAALAGLALVAAALSGCSKPQPAKAAEAPLTVTVAPVAMRPMKGDLLASGLLVSREEAGVAAELSGYRVAKVYVEQGARVRAGQPLAQLDDTLLRAQIAQARANLAQQQVAAERAEAEAARVTGLDNQGVLSEEAITERRLAARSARAAVAVAQAQLRDLETRDSRMIIRAPVSGTVLERTVRPGDTSSPGANLFRIARDSLVELDAEVPEDQLHRVAVGEHVDVLLPSGAHIGGTVRLIDPTVDQQTKLGRARVALPVRSDLRPGGYGRATFSGVVRSVVAAPESAIRFDADGASVMVVGPENRVRRVLVRTGQRSGGYVELVQGPAPGARVVLGGSAFLLEGDRVRIASPAAATAPRSAS